MNFSVSTESPLYVPTDLLLLPVYEDEVSLTALYGLIQKRVEKEGFTGKKDTSCLVQTDTGISTILVMGMGKSGTVSPEDVLHMGARAVQKTKELAGTSLSCIVPDTISLSHLVVGVVLGNYEFTQHKNKTLKKEKKPIESVVFITSDTDSQKNLEYGQTVASAVTFARDLTNQSPSETPPSKLAEVAERIAADNKNITCSVLSKSDMEKLGMGGIVGIARGSSEEPKFIHLTYNGGGKKVITLVGKGITFDSGGLSIKTAQGMETMKLDMSGAALVLAVFSVLSKLHPEIMVHGLISATENMLGPGAIKPGDVVTAMNGKTIEILNTDAEGRVVLADAMSYAGEKIKSDAIIDVATLTGACMIALGEHVAGLFSNDVNLANDIRAHAKTVGEKVWELPLVEEYKEMLKSPVADIKNIAGKYGGAITGALFTQSFVPENTPWAHLDIAGPSFTEKPTPLTTHGATGFGIQLIISYLLAQ